MLFATLLLTLKRST